MPISLDDDPEPAAGGRASDAWPAAAPSLAEPQAAAATPSRPFRNVFACLVHEADDCVADLVRNLRHLDPSSAIVLYDGGTDPGLIPRALRHPHPDVFVHPSPRPMQWGTLHGFALDCMRFAREAIGFDTLTVVDSDQLAVRPGYSARLAAFLAGTAGVGVLGNVPARQPLGTEVHPAAVAWNEEELWRPFLRRFPGGEEAWVHWSFWPSTVLTADACGALVELFDGDAQLREILAVSSLWATEEILFPTLSVLLGFRVVANPCSSDFVKFRAPYSQAQLAAALARDDVYWMHPVPRRYDDPLRRRIRARFRHYSSPAAPRLRTAPR